MNKRLKALIITTILLVTWTGMSFVFAIEGNDNNQYIKVGLLYGSNAVASIDITTSGPSYIKDITLEKTQGKSNDIKIENSAEEFQSTGNQSSDAVDTESHSNVDDANNVENHDISVVTSDIIETNLRLSLENSEVIIYDRTSGQALGILTYNKVLQLSDEINGYFELNGIKYRGGITITQNTNGTMNVINYIDSEQYTQGVLNAELNYSNPIEALKAQAVTARSYGIAGTEDGGRHSTYDFDVCSSTHCQVYRGMTGETEKTNQAVKETSRLCLYFDNKVIDAYYHKNSGGYTQNIKDVWGSNAPYLKSVRDNYSPEYYWEKNYSFAELEEKLNAAGRSVGSIQKVEITEKNDNDYVKAITFYGSAGETTFKNEGIRSLLGYSSIKSLNFVFSGKVESETKQLLKEGNDGNPVHVISANGEQLLTEQPVVVGADGLYRKIEGDFYAVSHLNSKGSLQNTSLIDIVRIPAIVSELIEVIESKDTVLIGNTVETSGNITFTGLGYGHSIGMPQDSAVEMAKQGFTFEDILKYYYTGVTIM